MLQALAARQALAADKVTIDYGLHMTIGPADIAKLDQVADARAAGCGSFKLYMAYGLRLTDGELLRALEAIRDAGALAVVHAENWDVITTLIGRNLAAGRTTPHWHPRSRPAPLEPRPPGVSSTSPPGSGRQSTFSTSPAPPRPSASRPPRPAGWPSPAKPAPSIFI